MKYFSMLATLLFFYSCVRPVDPSPDCADIDSLVVLNKTIDSSKSDVFTITDRNKLDEFCNILKGRTVVYGPNHRSERGYFDVRPMKNGESQGTMSVSFTLYDGVIISGGVGKYYRSERMGAFIIENAPDANLRKPE